MQGYAYLGEFYADILQKDKEIFLKNKSEENAQQFRKDYDILYSIRLSGEEAYLDMCDFSETWKEEDRRNLQSWTDYASKENFCNDNIEMIIGFRFQESSMKMVQQGGTDYMDAYNQIIDLYSKSANKEYADLERENINPLVNVEGDCPLFYTLYDLNDDNIPELIIAKTDEKCIIDIRTFYDGETVRIFGDHYNLGIKNSCTIGEDNFIYIFMPSGAFKACEYIYELTNNDESYLKVIKAYEMNVDENNDLKYFDITDENRREISEAEYDGEVIYNYNCGFRFEWELIAM